MNFRILTAFFTVASLAAQAADPLPVSTEYWKSESFRKSFNASYRINARVEPFVDTKERGLLVEVQELMAKEERTNSLNKLKASPLIKTSAAIMFNAANLAYESGDLKYAEEQYLAAIKIFPTFLRAHQNLAVVYSQQNKYDEAYSHLLEAVRLGTQDGLVMGLLGHCYQKQGNFTSALQAFRQAQLTDSKNLEWMRGEAYCHDRLGAQEKALNLYEMVVKARPDDYDYALLLVNLYQRMDRGEDAVVQLELLRRKEMIKAGDQILLGQLHMLYGSQTLGVEAVREALKSGKLENPEVALSIVKFSLQRDDVLLAKEFYGLIDADLFSDVDPKMNTNFQRLGAWLILRDASVKDKQAAVTVLEEIVKKNPLDADSLYLLAQQEVKAGNKEKALLLFDQSARGSGEFQYRAMLEKGKLLVSLKRYEDALKPLKEYAIIENSSSVKEYIKAVTALAEANQ